MTTCKNHFPTDPTSSLGVCASCLRQRLLSLPPPEVNNLPSTDPPPPPLLFPRSVSPYVSRRKSDTSVSYDDHRHHQLFFSTPQAGPAAKNKKSKFQFLSNLFRSGSSKSRHVSGSNPDPSVSGSNHDQFQNASTSWISGFGRRRKSTLRQSSLDETTSTYGDRRGKGMSLDADRGDELEGGYSPESWRRTSSSANGSTRPRQARVKANPARTQRAGGIGFSLSPLMRPSPNRHSTGLEAGYFAPHLSTAGSMGGNRSRKLADFGKFNHDR